MVPGAEDFRAALIRIFRDATDSGRPYVDVRAGDLHRLVGGYPGANHRMPVCCYVMRSLMQPGDEVLDEPPKGKGANLRIRYRLPRDEL